MKFFFHTKNIVEKKISEIFKDNKCVKFTNKPPRIGGSSPKLCFEIIFCLNILIITNSSNNMAPTTQGSTNTNQKQKRINKQSVNRKGYTDLKKYDSDKELFETIKSICETWMIKKAKHMPNELVQILANHIQWEPIGCLVDAHKQCNLDFKAISWQMSCTLHNKQIEEKKEDLQKQQNSLGGCFWHQVL